MKIILTDFNRNVGEDDMSHLVEIIEKHDYSMDPQCEGKENFIHRTEKNIENRCLNYHVLKKVA